MAKRINKERRFREMFIHHVLLVGFEKAVDNARMIIEIEASTKHTYLTPRLIYNCRDWSRKKWLDMFWEHMSMQPTRERLKDSFHDRNFDMIHLDDTYFDDAYFDMTRNDYKTYVRRNELRYGRLYRSKRLIHARYVIDSD